MRRENKSNSRKQNIFLKASDCTLGVPSDYISIPEIIKLQQTGRLEQIRVVTGLRLIPRQRRGAEQERHLMKREIDL